MTFRVGQKVTLVRPGIAWSFYVKRGEILPEFGAVYTVRAVNHYQGEAYLHFNEIKNPVQMYSDMGMGEMDFAARHFRPVVERKTDISFAHEILRKTKVPA